MSAAVVWRNLSVHQRVALRLLRDRGTTAVGWGPDKVSDRLARSLLAMGAVVVPGYTAASRWLTYGAKISISKAGRAAVNQADAYKADPAAVSRAREKSRTPRQAGVPISAGVTTAPPGVRQSSAGPGSKSRTPAAVRSRSREVVA